MRRTWSLIATAVAVLASAASARGPSGPPGELVWQARATLAGIPTVAAGPGQTGVLSRWSVEAG